MKFFIFLIFLLASGAKAQTLRFDLLAGFANYSGDIQQKRFTLSQSNPVFSAAGTISITKQFALRGNASFTKLGADDKKNKTQALIFRNLNFKTSLQEFALMGEYDIFELRERKFSPYVFGGVGVFHFNPYTTDEAGNKVYLRYLSTEGQGFTEYPNRKIYKNVQLNIPFGAGVKYALSRDVFVGFEMGLRKLFTDYLDDVSTTYVDKDLLQRNDGAQAVAVAFRGDELKPPLPYPAAGSQRGNSKSKDYYYYGQFRISFRIPWFDEDSEPRYKSKQNRLGCPIWRK